MAKPIIWLLSAYHTDSHAYWCRWLMETFTEYDWRLLTLPGRHFRWRIRGNPISWLDSLPDDEPELIIATSMVDLSTLRGLHPEIASVRTLYYFHENQFAYPVSEHQVRSIEPQMVQLYGALCADRVLFNSRFNLESFIGGVTALLDKMPDAIPANISTVLEQRSQVLPIPIPHNDATRTRDGKLILWNHRWEYDKDPETFCEAMIALDEAGDDFELALLGARHDNTHPALSKLRERLTARIRYDEHAPAERYRQILNEADIVISTARHEFQGLSVLEAVSHGARPLVPDALCYVEQYEDEFRYAPGEIDQIVARIQEWGSTPPDPPDITAWRPETLEPVWRRTLVRMHP